MAKDRPFTFIWELGNGAALLVTCDKAEKLLDILGYPLWAAIKDRHAIYLAEKAQELRELENGFSSAFPRLPQEEKAQQ